MQRFFSLPPTGSGASRARSTSSPATASWPCSGLRSRTRITPPGPARGAPHRGAGLRYAAELRPLEGLGLPVRSASTRARWWSAGSARTIGRPTRPIGHTVGLAARMEALAEPGKAYLTEHAAKLVEGYFELDRPGRGRGQGRAARRGLRCSAWAGAHAARRLAGRGLSRFVGRADELKALEAALERGSAAAAQVIGVVAEPGVGKSRLCHEFAERCRAAVSRSRGAGPGARPAIRCCRCSRCCAATSGSARTTTSRVAREKIAGGCCCSTRPSPTTCRWCSTSSASRTPAPERRRWNPEARQRALARRDPPALPACPAARDGRQRGPRTCTGWTRAARRSSPRWSARSRNADARCRQLPARVQRGLDATPRLSADPLLAARAPESTARAAGRPRRGTTLARRLAELIHERTGGNPFFIEEVVRALVEPVRSRASAAPTGWPGRSRNRRAADRAGRPRRPHRPPRAGLESGAAGGGGDRQGGSPSRCCA